MLLYRASSLYGLQDLTIKDRTRHNVTLDCRSDPVRPFNDEEEKLLDDYIIHMTNIGYGYTISKIEYMAADFVRSLGKSVKAREGLINNCCFFSFLDRWVQIKLVAPQKLGLDRATAESKENISISFKNFTKTKNVTIIGAP
ncbi:hypothetical protein DPMN_000073 [Dreissena polymorpha]|uniref:Uncharacterized protein n=1 Tax=Dreissena polymorpha TaxID=45954 RepID=A0A9D4MJ01_DREPO|nr:hypothetical protein DPMN_000073 [Dreissena polymorpha]